MDTFVKDPQAVLDYIVDWEDALVTGESLSSSTWTVAAGLTNVTTSFSSTDATIWLSGGSAGITYLVTNHIITTEGREDDKSFRIRGRHL